MEYPSLGTPPAGSIRFNTDSKKMEIYNGDAWWEVDSTSPYAQSSGTRAVIQMSSSPSDSDKMDYGNISTIGNFVDFGDLNTDTSGSPGACASRTRGLFAGGWVNPANSNVIDYITIASTGNATDFGDETVIRRGLTGAGNQTRGIFSGGRADPGANPTDVIDYVTIAATGNAIDFGNLTVARRYLGSTANQTRALIAGGYTNPSPSPEHWEGIDYLTIASTGNSSDFGDMSDGIDQNEGNASAVRALFGGGHTGSVSNMIEYVTIATLGNAKDFGDLSAGRHDTMSASSSIRGIWSGGATPSKVDTIDYVQIASTGNATDFGNLSAVAAEGSGLSNGHGGLG